MYKNLLRNIFLLTFTGILCIALIKGAEVLDTVLAQQCKTNVEDGVYKLQSIAKCDADQISYELPNGLNKNPKNASNKSCFLFDNKGAGLTPCGDYKRNGGCPVTVLNALAVGEVGCGYIMYAGDFGGRLYTTTTDFGLKMWATSYDPPTNADSVDNGKTNTDKLIALGDKPAAQVCRRLGSDWYLPALQEIHYLWKTFGKTHGFKDAFYWSSTDTEEHGAWIVLFRNGTMWGGLRPYGIVRCVRR